MLRLISIYCPLLLLLLIPWLFHVNVNASVIKRSPYGGVASEYNGNPPLFIDWTQPRSGPNPGGAYSTNGAGCDPTLTRSNDYGDAVRSRAEIRRVKVVGTSTEEEEEESNRGRSRIGSSRGRHYSSTDELPPCPSGYYPPSNGRGRNGDYGPFGVGLFGMPSLWSERAGISPVGWLQGALFGGKK